MFNSAFLCFFYGRSRKWASWFSDNNIHSHGLSHCWLATVLLYICHITLTEIVVWCPKCFVLPGENKVSVSSALSFTKLLFQYKQSEAFSRLTKEMLQVLSVSRLWQFAPVSNVLGLYISLRGVVSPCQTLEGQSFRKAEAELALLDSLNSLLCFQRSRGGEDMCDGSKCEMVLL